MCPDQHEHIKEGRQLKTPTATAMAATMPLANNSTRKAAPYANPSQH
jgi:hypothetical protein